MANSLNEKQRENDGPPSCLSTEPNKYHICGGGLFDVWMTADCFIYNPNAGKYTAIGKYMACAGRSRGKDKGQCQAEKIILNDERNNPAVKSLSPAQRGFILANPRKEFFKHEVITCKIDENLNPKQGEDFKTYKLRLKVYIADIIKS